MRKKKIFISSVQKEFASERQMLFNYLRSDALLGLFFEPFLFENLPASDQSTNTAYIREVSKTDIYLGLFGTDYGYETANGLSPTELEFDEATLQHKTRLIFVKGDSALVRKPKMNAFIQKVGLDVIRKRFNSDAELIAGVYASLVHYLKEKEFIRSGPFDAATSKAQFTDIDNDKVTAFVARAKTVRNFPLSPSATVIEILIHLNLIDDSTLTNAAVLLFGKNPQRFVLSSEVKCAHFHGKEVAKPIPSYQVYKGTVFELVDQSVDFVLSKLNVEVGTRAASNQAPTKYEIPRAVISEAIVNAIAHRDYSSTGSVQIMLFSDRLEIWNPGTLASSLSLSQLKINHGSFPSNPLLAEPMYLAGYIERLGTGTRDMVNLCVAAKLKEPEFTLDDGFRVTIWRPKSQVSGEVSGEATREVSGEVSGEATGEVGEEVKRVILVLKGEEKRSDIQQKLDLKSDDYFRTNYIIPSLEAGVIEMKFPDNPNHPQQRYMLTTKGEALKKELKKSTKKK